MNNFLPLTDTEAGTQCYHCGNDCQDNQFKEDEKVFCCIGCQSVYQILSENQLCNYYAYNHAPGKTQNAKLIH